MIQDHFPLVPLETITQYLDTKKLSTAVSANIFLTKKVSTNKDTKTVNDLHLLPNDLVKTKPNNEWVVPQSLQPIPSFLSSSSLLSTISVNLDNRQPRLMGEWREGSSEFTIWTYGEIKILDTAPYFDIISPDGIIFIEEYINGIFRGKVNQLTIAKATTNVIERPKLGKEIDPAATVIKKGELIKIWSNNKSFLFFTKNMDKWIMDKVKNIASSFESKKQDNIIQEIPVTNQEWRTKVQRTRDFIDFIFMPTEEVEEQVERKQKRENLNLDAIPFKQIPVPVNTDVSQTWGRQIPIEKLYSGLKGISPIGKKFTTLIQGGKEAVVLKDLNFHLGVNTFKKLEFELTLYQVVDGNIKHAIIQEPIPISISEGAGWIQKDLSNYNIVSQGDIYVVLENIGFSGAKRGKTLYLSVSADSGSYEPVLKESTVLSKKFWERNFWELPFTMNVTTAGPSPVTSSTPKIKNTSQQKTSDPTLREQIHARLVNLHQVTDNNENFAGYEGLKEAIGDAEIIMLGEQSHGEATTYQTKIKLIKYLHQEMGFDILAFESSLYECDRAWSMIEEGQNVKNTLAKSIFFIWSIVQEFSPLYDYIEKQLGSERPLRVAGFDHQIAGTIGQDYFVADLTSYIHTFKDASVYQYQLEELKTFLAFGGSKRMKGYNKKRATASIAFLQELQELIKSKPSDGQSSFWLLNIKNLELFISDTKLGTDTRDKQMANNLVWLKEKYPNKKIICWGATSHFLYNSSEIKMDKLLPQVLAANYYKKHSMMGDYIKEKYGDKVYTIGFTAYEGKTANKKLKPPPANSLEFLIGSADADNYFLPLEGLSLENYMSRPLGNLYMTTDIATVIDGVIFNRHMKQPYTDWDFFMELVPENKYVPKKIDRLKEYQRKNKLKEDQ